MTFYTIIYKLDIPMLNLSYVCELLDFGFLEAGQLHKRQVDPWIRASPVILVNYSSMTLLFLILSPPANSLSSDVTMLAVRFWGQESRYCRDMRMHAYLDLTHP